MPNHIYFVTFATHERNRWFSDASAATVAARAIHDARLWQDAALLAWVLMPDHWYGLVQLGEAETLSQVIGRLKCNVSRQVRRHRPCSGPVWARAFHDRALRSDDDLLDAARYLVMNPVRAGLVQKIADYPYWNAIWLPP